MRWSRLAGDEEGSGIVRVLRVLVQFGAWLKGAKKGTSPFCGPFWTHSHTQWTRAKCPRFHGLWFLNQRIQSYVHNSQLAARYLCVAARLASICSFWRRSLSSGGVAKGLQSHSQRLLRRVCGGLSGRQSCVCNANRRRLCMSRSQVPAMKREEALQKLGLSFQQADD